MGLEKGSNNCPVVRHKTINLKEGITLLNFSSLYNDFKLNSEKAVSIKSDVCFDLIDCNDNGQICGNLYCC